MPTALVYLKRPWMTPFGRFLKSEDGEPTRIPQEVLDIHPLPVDAELVVGKDVLGKKKPKEDIRPETLEETNAGIEKNILEDVEEREKERAAKRRKERENLVAERAERIAKAMKGDEEEAVEDEDEENDDDDDEDDAVREKVTELLHGTVAIVTSSLSDLSYEELELMQQLETSGKNRAMVLRAIESELELFEDDE